ncbi:MAG: MoaD/ThiS family protein [Candidatus Thorarchaeota archaeon]
MRVKVRFRGPVSHQMGSQQYHVDVDEGTDLQSFLQTLIDKEKGIRSVWTDPETMDREALILCNEIDIGLTGGLETKLKEGDEVVILPLVHGG